MIIPIPDSRTSSPSSASTCAWTITSSAVVGSSAMIRSGRQASAIAIITRWRWPPESSCGIGLVAPRGEPDAVQQLLDPAPDARWPPRSCWTIASRICQPIVRTGLSAPIAP